MNKTKHWLLSFCYEKDYPLSLDAQHVTALNPFHRQKQFMPFTLYKIYGDFTWGKHSINFFDLVENDTQ